MLGLDSVFAFCYVLNLLSWEVSEQKEKGNQASAQGICASSVFLQGDR